MDCEPNWTKWQMEIENEGWIVENIGWINKLEFESG